MRGILVVMLCFLLQSCNIARKSQKPKDWVKIYEHELEAARKNDDIDAWRFFWPEYLKERSKR